MPIRIGGIADGLLTEWSKDKEMITQGQEIDKLRLVGRRLQSAVRDLLHELNQYPVVNLEAIRRATDALDFYADTNHELYEE